MQPIPPLLIALDQHQPIENWSDIAKWDYNTLGGLNTDRLKAMSKRYKEYTQSPKMIETVVERVIQRHNSFMMLLAVEAINQKDQEFLHAILLNTHNIVWPAGNFGWMCFVQCLGNPEFFDFDMGSYDMLFDEKLESVMSGALCAGFLPAVAGRLLYHQPAFLERVAQSPLVSARLEEVGLALLGKNRPKELLDVLRGHLGVLDVLTKFMQQYTSSGGGLTKTEVKRLLEDPSWKDVRDLIFNHSLKQDIFSGKSFPSTPKKM